MKHSIPYASLFTSLFLLCGSLQLAEANDSGFYAEFGVGRSIATESVTSLDEDATGFRIAAGYQFTPWLSVDASYIDLGKFDGDLIAPNGTAVPFSATSTGIELALVGRIPIGERFAATVRAGNLWWDSRIEIGGPPLDDSGNDFIYGAGVEFGLGKRLVLTGLWQQSKQGDTDVSQYTLGVRWKFGASAGK